MRTDTEKLRKIRETVDAIPKNRLRDLVVEMFVAMDGLADVMQTVGSKFDDAIGDVEKRVDAVMAPVEKLLGGDDD